MSQGQPIMRQAKTFDCVAMMHEGAELISEQTRGMSREKELRFWRQGEDDLARRCRPASELKRKGHE